jgi:hypothetical protein
MIALLSPEQDVNASHIPTKYYIGPHHWRMTEAYEHASWSNEAGTGINLLFPQEK